MVFIGQVGCIRAKVVVFVQNLLYLGKNWLYSGKSGFIRVKRLYSGKLVVFGQSGCIRTKWLYSRKNVAFGQKYLYSDKVVVFKQKLLYS